MTFSAFVCVCKERLHRLIVDPGLLSAGGDRAGVANSVGSVRVRIAGCRCLIATRLRRAVPDVPVVTLPRPVPCTACRDAPLRPDEVMRRLETALRRSRT